MSDTLITLQPSYTIHEDQPGGVVHMTVEGFYDVDTLNDHFADSADVVDRWRAAGLPIRVFIDAVNLKPHSPEGQTIVQDATARIYRSGDRVAVQVASSLVKMQMRRAFTHGDIINFFISKTAALIWLGAGDETMVREPTAQAREAREGRIAAAHRSGERGGAVSGFSDMQLR